MNETWLLILFSFSRRVLRPSVYRGVCLAKIYDPPADEDGGANKPEPPPLFARLLDGPTSRHFNNAAIAKFTIILLCRHLHAPHKSSPILSSFARSPQYLPFVGRSAVELFTREPIFRENKYYIITELSLLNDMWQN